MPELSGVSHRDVVAGGVRLHVAEAGEGEPVVCLHGWPQNWWVWRGMIPALAERYRVICLGPARLRLVRGAAHGYEKENLAADMLGAARRARAERVKLVGHDWGGWSASCSACARPERFERYLALNIRRPGRESRGGACRTCGASGTSG